MMAEQQSVAEIVLDAAVNFEKNTHEQEKFAHKIAHKTKRVIRVSIVFLTMFTVFTAFSIYSLAEVLEETITHMETMYGNFGTITAEMNSMTNSVTNMEREVSEITTITEGVSSMRQSVTGMEQDMVLMDQKMVHFNQDIQQIQQDTEDMSVIFDRVNQSMAKIRYDASEISRTARIFPTP